MASLAVCFRRVPHGQFRLTLDIDFVWVRMAWRVKRSDPRKYIQAAGKEEMRANLYFIYELFTHLDRLVIGYEIVGRRPNGLQSRCRYLHVGKGREMEVDLGMGMLLKERHGQPTMYREMAEEEL